MPYHQGTGIAQDDSHTINSFIGAKSCTEDFDLYGAPHLFNHAHTLSDMLNVSTIELNCAEEVRME